MAQDATWYDIVLDGHPAPLTEKGHTTPPTFRSMSVMAKWLGAARYHWVWG